MSKARQIFEGVYEISLAWSNVYLLKEGNRAALIDTGLQKDRADLLAALGELGLTEKNIDAVYLTHAHCDHAGSAAYFARQGAKLHVHYLELPFIGLPRQTYIPHGFHFWRRPLTALLFALGERQFPVERCVPDVLLTDGETLKTPWGLLRVVGSPGHTPGHTAYFREQDGLLFSGDAILTLIPVRRTNALSLPLRVFSTDWRQVRRSAHRLADLQPAVLLAGHGWPLLHDTARRLADWAVRLKRK